MSSPKKFFLGITGLLLAVFSFFPQPLYASQNKYFDYGPYYSSPQVLGFSLSNLENLPALQLPENLKLPRASGILPDSPFYTFEKVIEGAQLAFTFDPAKKEELRLEIASERLAEAKTLMDQGKTGAASEALDDYSRALATVAENLPALPGSSPATQTLLSKAEEVASAQTVVAAALSLASSPAQAEGWTEAGSASKQVLDKIAEVKGEPAIPENLSTGLQSLKEQGLLSEEESNKLYSLKNRSEVRDELNKLTSSGSIPPSELIKLDEAVARYYPEVQNQQITNFQVVELRSYQTLPQPGTEAVKELQKWQENPGIPPSNDIKPYLWYNRAEKLASAVNLSNFSESQQNDLVKLYPRPVVENPTYSPPPSPVPSPTPSTTPTSTDAGSPSGGAGSDQPATPAAQASAVPSPTPPAAEPYLEDAEGALPGQPTYILKQIGEGFNFAFTFDPAEKARIRMQQAERRLAEAEALSSDPKKATQYESALANYQTALNDAASRIKQLKDTPAAKQAAEKLEAQASRHEVIFEKGLLPPPAKNPKLISDAIKATEDAMDRSADKLDRPALPRILSSRLDDLKAQGLILPEEAEDLVGSESREEVRSKIRKLVELKTFPLADAKKLDEAQTFSSPADFNQLVEVRKVEELQNLRSVQTDLAQTPTLRATATNLSQKETQLTSSIDPTLIKAEDLGGRDDLIKTYQKLSSTPRPINGGQFGPEATPGAQPVVTPPSPRDAVLTTCPGGATFKQFEGCVWADSGRKINDYDQYKCDGPRQYYSFAVRKCVASEPDKGYQEDAQPICPIGYQWSWPTQSCQTSRGGILPYPSPSAQPKPKDVEDVEELNKSCPEGSSFLPPSGCFWDDDGKSVYDPEQYRCSEGRYYSFEEHECVPIPKPGVPYPKNTTPTCKAEGFYWNWSTGQCLPPPAVADEKPLGGPVVIIDDIKPTFVSPGNPFYFLKQAAERAQYLTAFTPTAREQVTLAQAEERLAEAVDALKKDDQQGAKKALAAYTNTMQNLVGDLSKESLTEMAKNEIGKRLSKEAVEHNLLLQKLQALAPAEQDSALSAATSVSILSVDKAADIAGEPAIPDELKSKIEALPEKMISEEDKKALLEMDSRVDARLKLGGLIANGALTQTEASFLNEEFDKVDPNAKIKVEELKKLEEIASATNQKEKLEDRIEKNEDIVKKLSEFQKDFEPGKEVPSEIRPYVRLTRIEEITQTIRPDIVKLEGFQNRKDLSLAVATLQEEFKPTRESFRRIEEFRRRNPNIVLPPDLARIEALSYSLGVRNQAESCYLPTPPFPANTPCPPPGAAIQIASYTNYVDILPDWDYPVYGGGQGYPGYTGAPSTDKDGKQLVYGEGPKPANAGVCPDGFHWMYDSGGWCMSNSGNYSSSSYPSSGGGPGYTPYSPYYTAPGVPSAGSSGYPAGGYSAPSYYGSAPTYYTTTPPAGTVPGSGPKPTAPGQCPSGFHWMSDSGGWCMADGPTYVPGGPYSPNLNQSSCGPGYYWDGKGCIPTYSGSGSTSGSTPWCWSAFPSPDGWGCGSGSSWDQSTCSCKPSGSTSGSNSSGPSYQYGCTPGYYWNGSRCVAGSNEGSGWSDSAARSQSWCQPPSGGCGSNSYWDYGSCYCRSSSTYYGGSGPSPSNQCQGLSCGGGAWLDYSTCSCRYSGGSGTSSTGSTITCYPPSAGCPGGWYDYGTCSCKTSSSTSTTSGGSSSGSCPAGSHWMSDNGGYCMSDAGSSSSSSGGSTSTTSSGSSTSGGSCPSGYHWMSDNGGWCMQDGAGSTSTSTSTTSSPAPSSSPAPTTESTPPPSSAPSTESAPAPTTSSEPAPAPSP